MQPTCVALLAEGVDRNHTYMPDMIDLMASPSTRRAWIEILGAIVGPKPHIVALLAEGVDRNIASVPWINAEKCRPPRGGRG